jgi:hypothetical protein
VKSLLLGRWRHLLVRELRVMTVTAVAFVFEIGQFPDAAECSFGLSSLFNVGILFNITSTSLDTVSVVTTNITQYRTRKQAPSEHLSLGFSTLVI